MHCITETELALLRTELCGWLCRKRDAELSNGEQATSRQTANVSGRRKSKRCVERRVRHAPARQVCNIMSCLIRRLQLNTFFYLCVRRYLTTCCRESTADRWLQPTASQNSGREDRRREIRITAGQF